MFHFMLVMISLIRNSTLPLNIPFQNLNALTFYFMLPTYTMVANGTGAVRPFLAAFRYYLA